MKVGVINYGMGNLGSVCRAFKDLGADVYVAERPSDIGGADRIVLPGVGAFKEGMDRLSEGGWISSITEMVTVQRVPMMGICLGMQMLASTGSEGGCAKGLSLIPGRVGHLESLGCSLRVPHVGWNEVHFRLNDDIFDGIADFSDFYFVHSYAFIPEVSSNLLATVSYGVDLAAIVRNEHVFGCQFHPEKSSKVGRRFLRNFLSHVPC